MKKFVKGILIVSLLLFVTGTGCLIAGCVMGITSGDIMNALKQLPFIDFENQMIITEDHIIQIPSKEENVYETEKSWNYQKEEVRSIELELSSANCTIYASEDEQIRVIASNVSNVNVYLRNGVLAIEKENTIFEEDNAVVGLYLPVNWNADSFEIQAGAGNIVMECPIQADEFTVEAGASALHANAPITALEFEIELGAGMASFDFVDAEHIEIKNGAGQTEIALSGQKENYSVTIESAAGNVQYGEDAYSGIANTYRDHPKDAVRTILIESALGEVNVTFEEVV